MGDRVVGRSGWLMSAWQHGAGWMREEVKEWEGDPL